MNDSTGISAESVPSQQRDRIDESLLTGAAPLLEDEVAAFVGVNSRRYLSKWCSNNSWRGWNWASAFLGIGWLGGRKLHKAAVIALVCVILIGVLIGFSANSEFIPALLILLATLGGIVLGVL